MAIPVVGAVIGAATSLIVEPLFHPITSIVSAYFTPQDYVNKQEAWAARPWTNPEVGLAFRAYATNYIGGGTARNIVSKYGIGWTPSGVDDFATQRDAGIWARTFNLDAAGTRRMIDQRNVWEDIRKSQLVSPPIQTYIDLFARSMIDEESLKGWIERSGGDLDRWQGLIPSMYVPLEASTLVTARNRGIVNDDDFDNGLKRLGYRKPFSRYVIDSLREAIPGVQDLIMFGVRDVWDAQAVSSRQLFDETPPQLTEWASKQGLFGDSGIVATINGVQRQAKWPEVYWAAHWQPLPLQSAQRAFHILRPGREDRYADLIPGVQQFTLASLELALKIADYPVGDRPTLEALAYNPIGRREINRAITLRARLDKEPAFAATIDPQLLADLAEISVDWAVQAYRDLGLTEKDATAVVNASYALVQSSDDKTRERFKVAQLNKQNKAIVEAYRNGAIPRERGLFLFDLSGIGRILGGRELDLVDVEMHTATVKNAVTAIRKDYFDGVLTAPAALNALTVAGVQDTRADDYIVDWTILRGRTRRTATTEKLLKWYETGLITLPELTERFTNLGWSNQDQLTLLREAQLAIAKLQAQRTKALSQTRRQAAKQLESVQKQALAQGTKAQASLRKAMPRASILAWLKKQLITPRFASDRLLAQGYPQTSVDLWIREVMLGKQQPAATGPAAKTTAEPVSASGTDAGLSQSPPQVPKESPPAAK